MFAIAEKIKDVAINLLKKHAVALFLIHLLCCIGLLIALILVLTNRYASDESCKSTPNNKTQLNLYLHAAVASDAAPCANVANYIMMVKGGNAIDGAIAGLVCNCAVNFHSCGIGGGSFMVIYIKRENKVYAIDIREQAPLAASETMFVNDPKASLIGGKSIAVMGLVSGYYEIHQRFGFVGWEILFQPTIDLLKTGFFVTKSMTDAIQYFYKNANKTQFPDLWAVISDPNTGEPKTIGDIIKNPKLSKTLSILAKEPYAMRNGSLVGAIIREIQSAGGIITEQDLAQYTIKWRKPVSVTLNDGKILYTMPPPSSGTLIAFSLKVLAEFSYDNTDMDSCDAHVLFLNRYVETSKFAFSKRSALGDMDFVNVTQVMTNLTSDNYAKWIRSLITDDKTHPVKYYHPSFADRDDHGTSHFSLISRDGDAVSATSTINYLFGSLVMGTETGIIYNNEMDDFSTPNSPNIYNLQPSSSNFIKPKKRPMSSMSPIIIVSKTGNVELIAGASGGSKIISATSLVAALTNVWKRTIKESIDHPRLHHQLIPDRIMVEPNLPKGLVERLKKRGHTVDITKDVGVVQGIHRSNEDSNYIECNADFRKGGQCDGY